MPRFLELSKLDFQLALQQVTCAVCTDAQDVRNAHEDGLVVKHHATIGGQAHLTICERVERIEHFVRRDVVGQVHHHLHLVGGVVLHLLDLDLALVVGLQDAVNQRPRGHPVRNLANDQRLAVDLVDSRTHANTVPAKAVVVVFHVRHPAGGEIRIELEAFVLVVRDARINQLNEVVGQDFASQTNRNPVHPARQQQRKFHRKRFRFLVPAVV